MRDPKGDILPARVAVHVRSTSGEGERRDLYRFVWSDAEGRFVVGDLPAGTYDLKFTCEPIREY